MSDLIVTIDVSTNAIHVSLVNSKLDIIHGITEKFKYIDLPASGAKELDTNQLWEKMLKVIKEIAHFCEKTDRIVEIAVTSQREGCVFLDSEDEVISACPNIDARASTIALTLPKKTKEEIYDITGHWPNYLFPAMRLLWFKQEDSSSFRRISRFMMLNEWIAYKLTGKKKSSSLIEKTNAAESLFFDVRNLCWSDNIINALGMSHLRFSEVVDAGSICGTIDEKIAKEVGLGAEVKVKISMADTQSAVLGSGILKTGDIAVVNGSTTPVQIISNFPLIDKQRRTWTCPYLPGRWVIESNCSLTGKIFNKFLMNLQEFILDFDSNIDISEEKLDEIIFDNKDNSYDTLGFFGPGIFNVSSEKFSKFGFVFSDERTNIFYSIFVSYVENLAFAIKANIEQLEEIVGKKSKRVILTGGGSRNSLLRVLLPTILQNHEVYITKELNTTAVGAALIGKEKQNELQILLSHSLERLMPKENRVEFYVKKYSLWEEWYSKFNDN